MQYNLEVGTCRYVLIIVCKVQLDLINFSVGAGRSSEVERDVAQSIACPPLKRSVVGSILLSGPSCSLGYFPFQPVVHNWFIKGRGMYCSVYGKVHIKDPLLLIEKSSLCGGSGFPSKKCVNVTIWMTSNNRW